MSMLASMSKQSDGLGVLQLRLKELLGTQPTKTISGERSSWYHDYTDWAYTGGLT